MDISISVKNTAFCVKMVPERKMGFKIQQVRDGMGKNLLCGMLVGSTEQPLLPVQTSIVGVINEAVARRTDP